MLLALLLLFLSTSKGLLTFTLSRFNLTTFTFSCLRFGPSLFNPTLLDEPLLFSCFEPLPFFCCSCIGDVLAKLLQPGVFEEIDSPLCIRQALLCRRKLRLWRERTLVVFVHSSFRVGVLLKDQATQGCNEKTDPVIAMGA